MLQTKAESLVKKLIARDIVPIKIDKGSPLSDPAIWITESIYVQVSTDCVAVFRDRPTGLEIYECSNHIDDIVSKVKQAIDEGKPKQ